MKNVATWKLQTEAFVSLVEKLMGSQTISGAFFTQIQLPGFNVVSMLILTLWSLSPLGSQASYRVVRISVAYNATNTTITSSQPEFSSPGILLSEGSSFSSQSYAQIITPFVASISSARLLGTQNDDLWGNLRLPFIEHLMEQPENKRPIVITNTSGIAYSSLTGFPVSALPVIGNTSFTLSGSYMNITCSNIRNVTEATNFTDIAANPPGGSTDCTWEWVHPFPSFIAISQPCTESRNLSAGADREARRLIYETANILSSGDVIHLDCELSTTYVDTTFNCDGSSSGKCAPTTIRRSINPPYSRNWTILDNTLGLGFPQSLTTRNLMKIIQSAFPDAGLEDTLSSFATYLMHPDSAIHGNYDGYVNETEVLALTRWDYETRLAQLLNSIFALAVNPNTGGNGLTRLEGFQNVTGTTTVGHDVIRCDRAWLSTLLWASAVMCLIGLTGGFLRFVTLVPDILGSLTLAMLPNQFDGLEGQSTGWSQREWLRRLGGLKLRLGDVDPSAEVGRLALAGPVEAGNVSRVKRGRYFFNELQRRSQVNSTANLVAAPVMALIFTFIKKPTFYPGKI